METSINLQFTLACLGTFPLNGSEAVVDQALTQYFLLFVCIMSL